MKIKKVLSLACAIAMVAGLTTGCGVGNKSTSDSTKEAKRSSTKDSIIYGTPTAPGGTFNPVLAYLGSDTLIDNIVYGSLLSLKPDGSYEGYIANRTSGRSLRAFRKIMKYLMIRKRLNSH